ncbi:MAG: hypothetical protein AABY79_05530 [Nitrospirota bacterium]|jgi:hypothetical protein
MEPISNAEIERRIRAWADVTMLSLELKRAAMKKRYPKLKENELKELMLKELLILKTK